MTARGWCRSETPTCARSIAQVMRSPSSSRMSASEQPQWRTTGSTSRASRRCIYRHTSWPDQPLRAPSNSPSSMRPAWSRRMLGLGQSLSMVSLEWADATGSAWNCLSALPSAGRSSPTFRPKHPPGRRGFAPSPGGRDRRSPSILGSSPPSAAASSRHRSPARSR